MERSQVLEVHLQDRLALRIQRRSLSRRGQTTGVASAYKTSNGATDVPCCAGEEDFHGEGVGITAGEGNISQGEHRYRRLNTG